MLYQIDLPPGQHYTFTYDIYGEIDKVILPTGGYERYEYAQISALSPMTYPYAYANRGVVNRYVSASGTGADEVQWHYDGGGNFVSITAPDLTQVTHSMLAGFATQNSFGYTQNSALAGLPHEQDYYSAPDGSGVRHLLRRELTDWVATGSDATSLYLNAQQYADRNPRKTKEVVILLDTGGNNALAKTTTYDYDTTYERTTGALQTAVHEYDYATVDQNTAQTGSSSAIPLGTLLRTTETTYLDSNSSYRSRNILGLPTTVTIKDNRVNINGSNVIAQTTMSYDETTLSPDPNITGWTDPGTPYRGNLTTTSRWLTTSGSSVVTTQAGYDQAGNVVTTTDALNHTTTISYDDSFTDPSAVQTGKKTYAYPTSVTTPAPDPTPDPNDPTGPHGSSAGFTTSTKYVFGSGTIDSTLNANGQLTKMEYEASDFEGHANGPQRLTKVTRPDNSTTTYAYGYTPSPSIIPSLYVHTKTDEDANQKLEAYQYFDGLGRAVRACAYTGDGQVPWVVTETQYDNMGRLVQVSNPYAAADTNSSIGLSVTWTTTGSDALGRTLTVTTPDNAVVATAYSGNAVTVTDQQGKVRRSVSDALGRLIRVDEPDANNNLGSTDAPAQPTYYSYDALSNLRKVSQGGQLRYFMYDMVGRLIRVKNPEQTVNSALALQDTYRAPEDTSPNSQWTLAYTYDENGNLKSRTDTRNITASYNYDAHNRVTSRSYTTDPSQTPTVAYKYDGVGVNGGIAYSKGQLTSISNVVSTTTYDVFDVVGRVKQSTQTTDGQPSYVLQYGYDLAGHLISETYPSGRVVTTTYDVAGRISAANGQKTGEANKPYASNFSYAPHGAVSSMRLGNGLWEHTNFNSRLQPGEIGLGTSNTDSSVLKLNYTYGKLVGTTLDTTQNNGNIESQTITTPDLSLKQSYTYDELNRLKTAREVNTITPCSNPDGSNDCWRQVYKYDRFGNRNFDTGTTTPAVLNDTTNPVVDPATNRISPTSYSYDVAGNLQCDPIHPCPQPAPNLVPYFTYDGENRLVSASSDSGYSYDGAGQRVKKTVGGVSTIFVYDIQGQLVAEPCRMGQAI